MVKYELLIWVTAVNEIIHWNHNVEIEYFLEKYSILSLKTKEQSHQLRLNTTRD